MKKGFRSALYITCATIMLSGSALAQNDISFNNSTGLKEAIAATKTDVPESAKDAVPVVNVNAKVLRSFFGYFKNVTPTWSTLEKEHIYMADFNLDGKQSKALFLKDGFMIYAISFGTEKNLPSGIRKLIKSNYVDYNIGKVTEVNAAHQKGWVVNLENENNLVILKVVDETLEEMESYDTHPSPKHKKGKVVLPQ